MHNVAEASKFEEIEGGKTIKLAKHTENANNSMDLQVAIHDILSKNASKMDSELIKGS